MALAVVQSCYTRTVFVNHTVTFPTPVTPDNLILLFCNNLILSILNQPDWTPVNPADTDGFFLAYRYAQAGDGTTPPPFWLDTSNISAAEAVEISGVTGIFASDFEGYVRSSSTPVTGNPTVNPNALAFCASGQGSGFGAYTVGAGFTNLQTSGTESMSLDYAAVPVAGTSPTDAPNWSAGGTAGHWVMAIVGRSSGSPGEGDTVPGTVTLTAPGVEAQVPGQGSTAPGTVTLTPPAVVAELVYDAPIGTVSLRAPRVRAHIETGVGDARVTQAARLTLGVGAPTPRATQAVRLAIAEIIAQPRVTQCVRLTIAPAIPCTTKWCQCWRIQRRDGVTLRFTSLDEDFLWGNLLYKSCDSLNPSAAESASTVGQVGNIELQGVISSDDITEADLYGGLYDDAFVEVWIVPYEDTAGEVPRRLAAGWTGNLSHSEAGFNMEVIGPGARLDQQALTQQVTPTCRWVFGDNHCTKDAEALKKQGFVMNSTRDRGTFTAAISEGSEGAGDISDGDLASGEGGGGGVTPGLQWANGRVRWTSGRNLSQVCEVKSVDFDTGTIVLWALPAFLPEPGDAFDLLPGCDNSAVTCKEVYGNYLNFGGFRDVPGQDSINQTPDAKY